MGWSLTTDGPAFAKATAWQALIGSIDPDFYTKIAKGAKSDSDFLTADEHLCALIKNGFRLLKTMLLAQHTAHGRVAVGLRAEALPQRFLLATTAQQSSSAAC